MNHITIIGNLGQDPELSYTTNGKAKVKFSIADTREYNGEKETTWHRCVAWGKTAENVAATFSKGQRVMVTGRYKTDTYKTKAGEQKSVQEVLVDDCGHSIRFDLPGAPRQQKFGMTDTAPQSADEEPF